MDAHHDVPLIVADAADEAALRELASKARVVISTVGPYAVHGEPLVKVCAESGTDYCDLTGEVQWIRRMIERYEKTAASTGARIVHCCGFDSIPSDLGVHFLQHKALVRFAEYDVDFGAWVAPFVMAGINTRVVHRSNALAACA